MAATATQKTRFRLKMGDNDASNEVFGDTEIDALFDWSAEDYTDSKQIFYAACLLGMDVLLADAAKQVTYKQNMSSENLSDSFKHLKQLRAILASDLDEAVQSTLGAVRLGVMRGKPLREKDIPG